MTVASYIVAISAFAVLVTLIMSLTLSHSYFGSSLQQQQAARNAAEAALQQAMVTVLNSPNQAWGTKQLASDVVVYQSTTDSKATGIVTFNPTVARDKKVAQSWNNLRGTGIRPGSLGRQVPINVVQLVARGVCGDSVKTIEMLFHVPPFPNALASEGPIKSSGGLLVGGVTDPSKFGGSYSATSDEDKTPAHVVSNYTSADAVKLGPGAIIEGNVAAVGGVVLDPSVRVSGQIRQHIEPQPIPQLDLNRLFGRIGSQVGSDPLGPSIGTLTLKWNAHRDGNLLVDGDLDLESGMLFVKGDLTVRGGVTGKGAIFVQGETQILGGASFRSSDQVALVSGKRILLNGQDKNSYFFQGLMYTSEHIVANDVTVLGAVIARGVGGLELNNVNLLNSPVTLSLNDGLEMLNFTDDDSVKMVVRVEKRDPITHKPTSYKAMVAGYSDEPRAPLSKPVRWTKYWNPGFSEHMSESEWQGNLKNYDQIRQFLDRAASEVGRGYARNAYKKDWYWNARKKVAPSDPFYAEITAAGPDPLRTYLDMLEGKVSDPQQFFSIDLNPNEVLGVLDRSRVLLWREVSN